MYFYNNFTTIYQYLLFIYFFMQVKVDNREDFMMQYLKYRFDNNLSSDSIRKKMSWLYRSYYYVKNFWFISDALLPRLQNEWFKIIIKKDLND